MILSVGIFIIPIFKKLTKHYKNIWNYHNPTSTKKKKKKYEGTDEHISFLLNINHYLFIKIKNITPREQI